MSEKDQSKTQSILLLPPMVEDLRERMKDVERDSRDTKIYMARVDERMQSQGDVLMEIKAAVENLKTDSATQKGRLWGVGTAGGAAGGIIGWLINLWQNMKLHQ